MVYAHFNNSSGNLNPWNGWSNIWRLSSRPKQFIWLLLHNGVKTYEYLHRLNLGPQTLCQFCNLNFESSEHLFNNCPKTQLVWRQVSNVIGMQIVFYEGFSSGSWLSQNNPIYDLRTKSIIVVTSWLIWKARCNLVFRQDAPDFQSIPIKAINHAREYMHNLLPSTLESNSFLTIFLSLIARFSLFPQWEIVRLILMEQVFILLMLVPSLFVQGTIIIMQKQSSK